MNEDGVSALTAFATTDRSLVPNEPGVYVIYWGAEVPYVGMAGRDGKGSLRRQLKDHNSGQIVNMFAQYLFLARMQFTVAERITHPREAKAACRRYIAERLSFSFRVARDGAEARWLEGELKRALRPMLNP